MSTTMSKYKDYLSAMGHSSTTLWQIIIFEGTVQYFNWHLDNNFQPSWVDMSQAIWKSKGCPRNYLVMQLSCCDWLSQTIALPK